STVSHVILHAPASSAFDTSSLPDALPICLIILKFPDRESVYGFVTRITPHWVHVLYKRYGAGNPNAGKPGFGPYPTVHEPIIGRARFESFVRAHGLTAVEAYGYGTLPRFQRLGTRLLAALSCGRLTARYYNLMYILESVAEAATASASSPLVGTEATPALRTGTNGALAR